VFKYIYKTQKGVVHIGTRLCFGEQGDRGAGYLPYSRQRQKVFLLVKPIQSPSLSVTGSLSLGVKRPDRENISV
jgi:hypothetical protein